MYLRIPFYIYFRSGRLHFVKKSQNRCTLLYMYSTVYVIFLIYWISKVCILKGSASPYVYNLCKYVIYEELKFFPKRVPTWEDGLRAIGLPLSLRFLAGTWQQFAGIADVDNHVCWWSGLEVSGRRCTRQSGRTTRTLTRSSSPSAWYRSVRSIRRCWGRKGDGWERGRERELENRERTRAEGKGYGREGGEEKEGNGREGESLPIWPYLISSAYKVFASVRHVTGMVRITWG